MTIVQIALISILYLPGCNSTVDHDFHLSKCDIDYSREESSLQVSISIFIDDLELALKQQGHDSLSICTQKEAGNAELLILEYLQSHLLLNVDGSQVLLEWVGKEISEDLAAVWCYLQVSNVHPQKFIAVTNDVLMELFDDQQNLVKLQYDKQKKSFFLFARDEYSGQLDL